MGKSSRMKFLVGHSGILVALFTCDDCIETFILMSWLILSFNTVLAAPIRTGYEGIRAGVSCYHFDARPLVACCAFYLDLLHQLFQGEVYLQLCGTPYGLFTKGAMAGSWFCCTLLIHVLQNVCPKSGKIIGSSINVSLKDIGNMNFDCSEFLQENQRNSHVPIRGRKEKKKTQKYGKMRPTRE